MVISNLKKEVISLYLIQIANILIPLATFPFFTRIIGVEGVGKIGFSQTVFLIISFLIDFGFNLTAARSISSNYKNTQEINKIYSNVLFFKFLLYLLILLILFPLIKSLNLEELDEGIIFIAFISAFGSVLTPNFLFNGLGVNSVLACITLIARILFIVPLFFIISGYEDLLLCVFLLLIPNFIIGVFCQYYVIKKLKIVFKLKNVQIGLCFLYIKEAYDSFIASFFTLGFTYSIPVLIKFTLGDYALGIYVLVDKIVGIMKQLYNPIIQAIYSKICILYDENINKYIKTIKKLFILFSFIGFLALMSNRIFGGILLETLFGKVDNLHHYVELAIFTQIIVSFAIIVVNFYILPSRNAYVLKKIYASGFLLFVPIYYLAQEKYGLSGAFYAMQITEFLIFCLLLSFTFYRAKTDLVKNLS